jgi:hypothetical protein
MEATNLPAVVTGETLPAEIQQKASGIAERAAAHVVTDQESYDVATNTLKGLKVMMKEIESTFDPIASKAHSAWKEVLAQKKRHLDPLETADKILRRKAADWFAIEDGKRKAEERRLEAEARKKAEDEVLARAQFLQDAGLKDVAANVMEQPLRVAPVIPVAPAPEKNGMGMREVWSFEIVDEALLPREFLMPDESHIRKTVNANKGATNIPGVKVTSRKDVTVR